jgi:integrase
MFQPGTSRHEAKADARASGAKGPSAVAAKTGIQSFATYKAYFKTGVELLKFCREVHGIKSADKITPAHVRAFLDSKIRSGVKLATFRRYAAGLTKIETALSNVTGQNHGWSETVATMREAAAVYLNSDPQARAYERPEAVISQLEGDVHLVADLQLRCGLRVSEATFVERDQLQGIHHDKSTGREVGRLRVTRTKGGRPRVVLVPVEVYRQLSERIAAGDLLVDRQQYRAALKEAVKNSGQAYDGRSTHGLRWNYAQQRMAELIETQPYEVALTTVSHELGHSRGSITEHYLRR